MYEKRKETAIDYMAEITLDSAIPGLRNASKFLNAETKTQLGSLSAKFEKPEEVRKGYEARIQRESENKSAKSQAR